MTDFYSYNNLIKRIKATPPQYLVYNPDIVSINPSVDFLKFYDAFVTPNMGIIRLEVNFDFLKPLRGKEKELAIEILTKNLSVPYYTPIYNVALEILKVPNLDTILVEQYENAIRNKNFQSALALASEIKQSKITYDFKPLIDEILEVGTDKDKHSAIWSTYKLTPEHCVSICIKYLDSPNYELRQAAFYGLKYYAGLAYSAPKDKDGNYLSRWDKDKDGKEIYYYGYEQFLSDEVFQNKKLFQRKKNELLDIFKLNQQNYR
jgi:hypothetical protein